MVLHLFCKFYTFSVNLALFCKLCTFFWKFYTFSLWVPLSKMIKSVLNLSFQRKEYYHGDSMIEVVVILCSSTCIDNSLLKALISTQILVCKPPPPEKWHTNIHFSSWLGENPSVYICPDFFDSNIFYCMIFLQKDKSQVLIT